MGIEKRKSSNPKFLEPLFIVERTRKIYTLGYQMDRK